jgi:hypothetical protein
LKLTFIAGIDHGFSFSISYFERYGINTWESFLDDFWQHCPTDGDNTYVDDIREKGPDRVGSAADFRLTEKWTSSAKSVFLFECKVAWQNLPRRTTLASQD